MAASRTSVLSDHLPGIPPGRGGLPEDPVFELAPGAGVPAAGHPAAIREDFGAQLHDAQEQLLDLRQKQEVLERRRAELEDLQLKQERFLKGRVDVVERLTKGLTRLDRDTFQARKRLEMLEHAKETFTAHLDCIEGFNPEHWSRADLRSELVRATAALEDAEQDYAEAMGRLGMGGSAGDAEDEAPAGPAPRALPGFQYWLMAGLAFTLPLLLLGLITLLVAALGQNP
jgi:hypothetical protein